MVLRGAGLEALEALPNPRVHRRAAVRAVIERDGLMLMTYSETVGDYGFPGGGLEDGESLDQALRRELREEIGADLIRVEAHLGTVTQRRPSLHPGRADIFEAVHEYLACVVIENRHPVLLEPYERDLAMVARWVEPAVALQANRAIAAELNSANPWIPREIFVLEWLIARRGS